MYATILVEGHPGGGWNSTEKDFYMSLESLSISGARRAGRIGTEVALLLWPFHSSGNSYVEVNVMIC